MPLYHIDQAIRLLQKAREALVTPPMPSAPKPINPVVACIQNLLDANPDAEFDLSKMVEELRTLHILPEGLRTAVSGLKPV